MDDISQWTMPQEARESLRHYLSAAILFPATDRDSSVRARTLAAFDRWFALGDAVQPAAPKAQPVQLAPETLAGAAQQSWELHIYQADAIRELLDLHAPETEGNLQTRIAQVFAQPEQPSPDNLKSAAQAVLDRWDSPQWKWAKQGPTGELMHDLRIALQKPSS